MDATDLARWTRFAAKGGIGKCTALQDCVAQGAEDLMFLKDDEIVVLLQLAQEDQYLGYCEGVVGRFNGSAVRFHGKLKKPVFAKRQSSVGTSPSRPISVSPRSTPPGSSGPASSSSSRLLPSPTTSPRAPSLSVTSTPSSSTTSHPDAFISKPPQSFRLSVASSSGIPARAVSLTHARTASTASSSSHYSTHSRSHSQSQSPAHMPMPAHTLVHARNPSTASSHSAYSSASQPQHSRADSTSASVSGSEDTYTQHVSLPPPPTQATPALTDGSSAHSSFLLTPAQAFSPSFTLNKAPASLFQGRARAGSEKLSPRETETRELRRRSGSENSAVPARRAAENDWTRRQAHLGKAQELTIEEGKDGPVTAASETSFRSVSVYSDASGGEEEGRTMQGNGVTTPAAAEDDIIREDDSGEEAEGGRKSAASSLSNLSDGGFGIGMTLLKEDDDGEDSEGDPEHADREDEETAVGHAEATEEPEKLPAPRLRTLAMRVMNPGSVSPSATESEGEGDVTIRPTPVQSQPQARLASDLSSQSSSAETALPVSQPAKIPTRPPLPTYASSSTIDSRRAPSVAQTEDEHWESDADIYDDYRYSRYSLHYGGSPAQQSSRRASKASTKSGRSRASERPPLPDEEAWKRGEGTEEALPRKSESSEQSSLHKVPASPGIDPKFVFPRPPPHIVAPTRVAEPGPSSRVAIDVTHRKGSHTPPPPPSGAEVSMPVTPGASSIDMASLTSPLTRAFRSSDVSAYSKESGQQDEEEELSQQEHRAATSILATQRLPSPGPTQDGQHPRSRSPALASSIREKIENERRAKSPILGANFVTQPPLRVVTTHKGNDQNVVVLVESPVSSESPTGHSLSSPDGGRLRVGSPQSHNGSAPPSPLNPGFPPSPSAIASFPPTAPLAISKSPSSSPSTPRHPISPPAIPFVGVPPPGRPPAHMQYAQYPSQLHQQHTAHTLPASDSLDSALRMAGQQRASTIHGRTRMDLLSATGPVPISFLLPGMMPPPPLVDSQPNPVSRLQHAAPLQPYGMVPSQGSNQIQSPGAGPDAHAYPMPPPPQSPTAGPNQGAQTPASRPAMRRPMTAPAPAPGSSSFLTNIPPVSSPALPATVRTNSLQVPPQGALSPTSPSTAAPLPRANFFPKVSQARPRSRSFSGFTSDITEKISQSLGRRSQEETARPLQVVNNDSRPSSPISKPIAPPLAPSLVVGPSRKPNPSSRLASHGPSPLSLPPTTNITHPGPPKSPLPAHSVPASPVTRTTPASVRSLDNQDIHSRRPLRQASSYLSLRPGLQAASNTPASSVAFPSGASAHTDDSSSLRPPSPLRSPTTRQSHESDRTHSSFTRSDMSTPPPFSNSSPASSPLVRNGSLRSKISISALRAKGAPRSIREGASEASTSPAGRSTPPADEETVQIKDMEFELVRPVISHMSSDLHRGEEPVDLKDLISVRTTDLRHDSSSVRSEALSPGGLSPSSDVRLHGGFNTPADPSAAGRKAKGADANNSVQAHRDRELRWISTMNSSDAAQARKSKKIKKLLVEGVPSSVRYLVWAHLSNSGSKKMPNVYAQLSKRRPVVAREIERDVEQSFPDHQHLRDPNGPLVSVLFAYIAMVPDLRYHRGLAIIAGHLLLQSPEEDAFWTFLAMMDSHLRPYFMPSAPQMGIDTTLFVKSVEAADPQLAKRVFVELNVRPQELCGVWFSAVFAGTLPLEHLHRVWDLFLYEGIPLLYRVGLAILSLSRRYLLEFSKGPPASYTAYLLRPPPDALPTDPEQFISQVLSAKLKDDDVRKSRLKMEAAASKQQQQRTTRLSTSQPSHPHFQGDRARAS